MRFIGRKNLMLNQIDCVIKENINDDFSIVGDLFYGSGIESQHFKKQGKN